VVIENYDRPFFRGFENEEAARIWLGAHLNFLQTGEFEVGPGQMAPILVDLDPQLPATPATPAAPTAHAPATPATHAPPTTQAPRNNNQPSTPTMRRPPPRGGGLFSANIPQPARCGPLSGLGSFGVALPDVTLAADTSSFKKPDDVPETPSPSKGKGRSYVNTLRCTVEGRVIETTHAQFTCPILNSLARQILTLQQDATADLVSLYLNTNYTSEAVQEIRNILDEDFSIEIMLDRLVRGGIPIREAFFILTLFQLARDHLGID
jgi:hypothetical protein